jgi:hypothetical protein
MAAHFPEAAELLQRNPAVLGLHVHCDGFALFAAEKRRDAGETFGAPQSKRMPVEDSVAIQTIGLFHRRVEVAGPIELLRDSIGLGRWPSIFSAVLQVGEHERNPDSLHSATLALE